MLLLNRERAAEESKLAEQQRAGIFKRAMHYLYGKPKDEDSSRQNSSSAGEENTWREAAQQRNSRNKEGEGLGILKAVEDSRETRLVQAIQQASQATASAPGPFDRLAEEATSSAAKTTKSWTSWVTGR